MVSQCQQPTRMMGISLELNSHNSMEGERHSMERLQSIEYDVSLLTGIVMFVMAVGGTCIGKLPGRFGEMASRTKDAKQYWSGLVLYYLLGIVFTSYYLYHTHAFSR